MRKKHSQESSKFCHAKMNVTQSQCEIAQQTCPACALEMGFPVFHIGYFTISETAFVVR